MSIKYYISTCLLIVAIAFTAAGQKKCALFVGISDYPESSGFAKIHGASDYEIIGTMLDNQGFKTTKLLNNQASAANIQDALINIAATADKGSWVYINFSCHGQPVEDKPPFDEDDLWDESIIPYDAKINYQSGVYEGENHIIDACRSYQFNKEVFKNGKHYGSLSYYVAEVLDNQRITKYLDWVLKVRELMSNDITLSNQNMVYESSF